MRQVEKNRSSWKGSGKSTDEESQSSLDKEAVKVRRKEKDVDRENGGHGNIGSQFLENRKRRGPNG